MRLSIGLGIGLAVLASSALADWATPSEEAAFAAGREGQWQTAYGLIDPADQLANDLLTWTRLRAGEGTFAEYAAFLGRRPDWPGLDKVRAAGELVIRAEDGPAPAAQDVVDFFANAAPQTGEGAAALVAALRALDQTDRANQVLQNAWVRLSLTDEGQAALVAVDPVQTAAHNRERLDFLIWRQRKDDLTRLLPLLSADDRALVEACLALLDKAEDADAKLARVPAALAAAPILNYARYSGLTNNGDRAAAIEVLLANSTSAEALGEPLRWSYSRREVVRYELREGDAQRAYRAAAQHFVTEGETYIELEWLAGYIALTRLNDPALALRHFQNVEAATDGPVTSGRAGYWIGRAEEALGHADLARAAYTRGARFQTGYYGLLAAEKAGLPFDTALLADLDYVAPDAPPSAEPELTRAALMLVESGERVGAVIFFAQLGKTLDQAGLLHLGAITDAMDEQFYTLILGKQAFERGMVIGPLYYPVHALSQMSLPIDPAMALAIARRESEFNTQAGSTSGAQGLMQLMPGTAEDVARDLGIAYSRGRLTSDWQYNVTLGSKYLADLEARFGPSPVLMAAGYNAGPRRPADWIDRFGDPRTADVDVVDWVENIPFRETRNYVQRVTEAVMIYEARLGRAGGPVQFTPILTGSAPFLRPAARPAPGAANASVSGSAYAPATSLRPVARP